jgi:hypothetical protein
VGVQTGWIAVALASLGIIGPIRTWVIDPKVRGIAALARDLQDGSLPMPLAERTHDRVLRTALHTMTAMLFGIIFLMTIKPQLTIALGAMLVSVLLGLASALLSLRFQGASPSHHHEEENRS